MSVQKSSYKMASCFQSSYKMASCSQSFDCKQCERYMMYASGDDWGEFLLTDSNLCLKYANRRRRWMHQLL